MEKKLNAERQPNLSKPIRQVEKHTQTGTGAGGINISLKFVIQYTKYISSVKINYISGFFIHGLSLILNGTCSELPCVENEPVAVTYTITLAGS